MEEGEGVRVAVEPYGELREKVWVNSNLEPGLGFGDRTVPNRAEPSRAEPIQTGTKTPI